MRGEGDLGVRTDIPGQEGEEVKCWMPKKETWREFQATDSGERNAYLSINAHTLEPKQEGFDLRDWVEQKRVAYLDLLEFKGEDSMERPHVGGTY